MLLWMCFNGTKAGALVTIYTVERYTTTYGRLAFLRTARLPNTHVSDYLPLHRHCNACFSATLCATSRHARSHWVGCF